MVRTPNIKTQTTNARVPVETREKAQQLAELWNTTMVEVYRYAVDRLYEETMQKNKEEKSV